MFRYKIGLSTFWIEEEKTESEPRILRYFDQDKTYHWFGKFSLIKDWNMYNYIMKDIKYLPRKKKVNNVHKTFDMTCL